MQLQCRNCSVIAALASMIIIGLLFSRVAAQGTIPQCISTTVCPSSQAATIASCTVTDDGTRGTHWSGNSSVFGCTTGLILVSHSVQGVPFECLPASATLAPPNGNIYTSSLSVVPSTQMDGALIQCSYPTPSDLLQECILNITNPPSSPRCVLLTGDDIEKVVHPNANSTLVTLSWSEPRSEGLITSYSITIIPPLDVYPSECGREINPCMISSTSISLRFNLFVMYNVSVSAVNCDTQQLGDPSVFNVYLKVPMSKIFLESLSLRYDSSSTILSSLSLSWRDMETEEEEIIRGCEKSLMNNTLSYNVSLLRGGMEEYVVEPPVKCCNYSFSLPVGVMYENITVRAENNVGVGWSKLSFPVSQMNKHFSVNVSRDLSDPEQPVVMIGCEVLSSMIPAFNSCTIIYGTKEENLNKTINANFWKKAQIDDPDYELYFYLATAEFRSDLGINITIEVVGNFTTCGEPPSAPPHCDYNVQGLTTTYSCGGIYELVGSSMLTCSAENKGWRDGPSSRVSGWFVFVIILVCIVVALPHIIVTFMIVKKTKSKWKKDIDMTTNRTQVLYHTSNKNVELKMHMKADYSDSSRQASSNEQSAITSTDSEYRGGEYEVAVRGNVSYSVNVLSSIDEENEPEDSNIETNPSTAQQEAVDQTDGDNTSLYAEVDADRPKTEEELKQMYAIPDKTKKRKEQEGTKSSKFGMLTHFGDNEYSVLEGPSEEEEDFQNNDPNDDKPVYASINSLDGNDSDHQSPISM